MSHLYGLLTSVLNASSKYSTRDLVKDLNEYFLRPMSFQDRVLLLFLILCVFSFACFLAFMALKLIWKKKDKKKNNVNDRPL